MKKFSLAVLLIAAAPLQAQYVQRTFIRINQLGYLPLGPKTAVACSLDSTSISTFTVQDSEGHVVLGPRKAVPAGTFASCISTHRLDFTSLRKPGRYTIVAGGAASPPVFIDVNAYSGAADTLLVYMRQQRSGFNTVVRDSVHKYDGRIVDHPTRTNEFINVSGGWADASDICSTSRRLRMQRSSC
jgi:hypothetical protein